MRETKSACPDCVTKTDIKEFFVGLFFALLLAGAVGFIGYAVYQTGYASGYSSGHLDADQEHLDADQEHLENFHMIPRVYQTYDYIRNVK